jgi:hypothetical protein
MARKPDRGARRQFAPYGEATSLWKKEAGTQRLFMRHANNAPGPR